MEAQGYEIAHNILYQDNKSTMLLLNNGKQSSSKRTRALNIRYFYLTDQIEKGNIEVEYCPTDKMVADYHSKPLQGKPFNFLRRQLLGHDIIPFPAKTDNGRSVLANQIPAFSPTNFIHARDLPSARTDTAQPHI